MWLDISQGSEEWQQARLHSIGGSSIGDLISATKQFSIESVILSNRPLNGKTILNQNFSFGHVFEDICRKISQMVLQSNIIEKGMWVTTGEHMHFSPDGICDDLNNRAVLCEFKCPVTRKLATSRHTIPIKYRAQIQHSMNQVPFDYAYYLELQISHPQCMKPMKEVPDSYLMRFTYMFYTNALDPDDLVDLDYISRDDFNKINSNVIPTYLHIHDITTEGWKFINEQQISLYYTAMPSVQTTYIYGSNHKSNVFYNGIIYNAFGSRVDHDHYLSQLILARMKEYKAVIESYNYNSPSASPSSNIDSSISDPRSGSLSSFVI